MDTPRDRARGSGAANCGTAGAEARLLAGNSARGVVPNLDLVHVSIVLLLLNLEVWNLFGLGIDVRSALLQRRLAPLVQTAQLGQQRQLTLCVRQARCVQLVQRTKCVDTAVIRVAQVDEGAHVPAQTNKQKQPRTGVRDRASATAMTTRAAPLLLPPPEAQERTAHVAMGPGFCVFLTWPARHF